MDNCGTARPPEIEFFEDRHEYRIDGAVVPSVTQVLEPIRRELGGNAEVLEYKRSIGKALDLAIELHERNDLDFESLDVAVVPFFEAWISFKRDSGFRVLLNQPIVHSRKLRFAGRPDLIGTRSVSTMTPDELLDTKCVWTIDPVTAIQTAGYSMAALESHGVRIKKRGGVQLLRDAKYKFHPYTNPADENVFKSCLLIHAWKALHK
jgi:hypothetical protein